MLQAAIISNGLQGLHHYFNSSELITYNWIEVTKNFNPDLSPYDVLIVPNGSDHIAMNKIKDKVHDFLNDGKSLLCFDGWFTDWIPGNQWTMDNSKKTIDVRYTIKNDSHELFKGVDINSLIYSHGISGWWSCGYIKVSHPDSVVVEDTWQRPIIVLDEKTTAGTMILTASGPLADHTGQTTDDQNAISDLGKLYQNMISFLIKKHKTHETTNRITV